MAHVVEIAGAGMVSFGQFPERSVEDMGASAVLAALSDAELGRAEIREVFCGSSFSGSLVGQRILRELGMTGLPITNVENACSSGGTAVREAVAAIVSERVDTALVIGVDKLTRFGGGTIPLEETDLEAGQGMPMPALYAMRAQRYMNETGATLEHLARVVVKAHLNGIHNPNAQFRNPVSIDQVLASRPISKPLTLFMCCPTGDGAAALVLRRRRGKGRAVVIRASTLQSGFSHSGYRDLGWSELVNRTASLAYEEAALGPSSIDVAEVHDAFAIAELMYYEALGFCERGDGPRLFESGETLVTGRIPVNPGGGLLCRGHPVGATGVAQICESVWQLRGVAGPNQVQNPRTALTQVTGGGISGFDHGACTVHILGIE